MDRTTHLRADSPRRRLTMPAVLLIGALSLFIWPTGSEIAQAQGPMDIGIVSPSFSELPISVQPGQTFTIGVSTAPDATCAGSVTFRTPPTTEPTIELPAMTAAGGICSWTVEVPPTTNPGVGTIGVDIARSGQGWAFSGVVYVSPPGENR